MFASGLGGKPRLLDVGGVPNLVPLVKREKLYDMSEFPQMCDMKTGEEDGAEKCLIIGAGAAPYTFLERNAEVRCLFTTYLSLPISDLNSSS